jgi:hypothetical protein
MQKPPSPNWNDDELRLAILQVLHAASKRKPQGGASGIMLMDCLGLSDVIEIEAALKWLMDKGYIGPGERVFIITKDGKEYLLEQLPQLSDPSDRRKKNNRESAKHKELKEQIEAWSDRAEMARKQGDTDLVRQALEHKRRCENELARLQEFEED